MKFFSNCFKSLTLTFILGSMPLFPNTALSTQWKEARISEVFEVLQINDHSARIQIKRAKRPEFDPDIQTIALSVEALPSHELRVDLLINEEKVSSSSFMPSEQLKTETGQFSSILNEGDFQDKVLNSSMVYRLFLDLTQEDLEQAKEVTKKSNRRLATEAEFKKNPLSSYFSEMGVIILEVIGAMATIVPVIAIAHIVPTLDTPLSWKIGAAAVAVVSDFFIIKLISFIVSETVFGFRAARVKTEMQTDAALERVSKKVMGRNGNFAHFLADEVFDVERINRHKDLALQRLIFLLKSGLKPYTLQGVFEKIDQSDLRYLLPRSLLFGNGDYFHLSEYDLPKIKQYILSQIEFKLKSPCSSLFAL